jgi:hypothetical protein
MRILLAIVIIAALGWSGYWLLGKQTVERGMTGWLEARQVEGWLVESGEVSTTGFPNRFDTTLSDLELADPDTGVAWRAPFLQIFALSYRPHHVIVVWPDRQTLSTPYQTITLTSSNMRGSMVFAARSDLRLDRVTVEFDNAGLVSTLGWQASSKGGQLAVRQTPVVENTYDVSFQARDLLLPGRLKDALASSGVVQEELAALSVEATVAFDAPWDRFAIEQRRPQPRNIELQLARASWGKLDLRLAGELAIDARGQPEGEITIKATNWREILSLAQATGALPSAIAPLVERGLATVARLSGNRDSIDVPLTFGDGRITLGGLIPLGPAPLIYLR